MKSVVLLWRLMRDVEGNVALIFSLAFPVLVAGVGLAVDSANFYDQQARMQTVADSTALAVAKELHLFLDNPETLKTSGESRAETLLAQSGIGERPHEANVLLDPENGFAQVEIAMVAKSFLPPGFWGASPIRVAAEAHAFGGLRLCVLGLDDKQNGTIDLKKGAVVSAPECAVQSNSADPDGISADDSSTLLSQFSCTSGGYKGPATSFEPEPETDCPAIEDALAERLPPSAGGCDYLDVSLSTGSHSISPGTYCGGLKVTGTADVTAEPGVYIIAGGRLEVGNYASLVGEYVGFYFADDKATIKFKDKATIELSAPRDGPLAGLLFFENPAAPENRAFEISSDSARKLLGTIYLSRGTFSGRGGGKIAELSAYTIIVAKRIEVDGAQLVVNADYAASDVPVPSGFGPNSKKVSERR